MNIKFTSSLTGFTSEMEGDTGILSKRRVGELRELAALIAQVGPEDSLQGYREPANEGQWDDEEPTVPGMNIPDLVMWAMLGGVK